MNDEYEAKNQRRINRHENSKYKPKGSMSEQRKRMEQNKFYVGEPKEVRRRREKKLKEKFREKWDL
jgi:hypothetical protein